MILLVVGWLAVVVGVSYQEEQMDSISIRGSGGTISIALPHPDWAELDTYSVGICHVPRLLDGEAVHDKIEDASGCSGNIVILSDISEDAAAHGVVAVGSDLVKVEANNTSLVINFFHKKFYAFQSEKLTIVLREELFADHKFNSICNGDSHASSDTHAAPVPSKCAFEGFVLGERRRLPGDNIWDKIRIPVALCFLIIGTTLTLWRPHLAALRAGHAFARVSLLHHTLSCPRDRLISEEFDTILSPLQLTIGDSVYKSFIGMLLGNITIIISVVIISAIITTVVYRLKRISILGAMCTTKVSWVLVPINIFSGGMMYSAVACFLYASPGWRSLGAFVCVLCLIFVAVMHTMTKRLGFGRDIIVMECVEKEDKNNNFFTGKYTWKTLDEESAHEFNHLFGFLVRPMKHRYRYFPFFDLAYTLFIAVLIGWSPSLMERCVVRTAFLTVAPVIWGLLVFWHFPFICMFDNVVEVVLSLLISVMMICSFVTHLIDPDPYSWGSNLNPPTFAGWAAVVAEILIFLKLLFDEIIFIKSRYDDAGYHVNDLTLLSLFSAPEHTCPSLCWDCAHLYTPSPKDTAFQSQMTMIPNILKDIPRMSSVHLLMTLVIHCYKTELLLKTD